MEDDFARHLLVDWKKRMYAAVQEKLIVLINERALELWNTDDGRRWLRAGDGAPPTIDAQELQEPALDGLDADGIFQEELVAFREGNIDKLTTFWMKQWCESGDDFAMGKYMKMLEQRTAKLAKIRQRGQEESPTTQRDSVNGIFKLAKDWGTKQMQRFTRFRKSV